MCGLMSIINFAKFLGIITWKKFCFSFFPPSCVLLMCILHLLKWSHNSWMLWGFLFVLTILSLFCLYFSLECFYWHIFKLHDSFLVPVECTNESRKDILKFSYSVLISHVTFCFFLRVSSFCLHQTSAFTCLLRFPLYLSTFNYMYF